MKNVYRYHCRLCFILLVLREFLGLTIHGFAGMDIKGVIAEIQKDRNTPLVPKVFSFSLPSVNAYYLTCKLAVLSCFLSVFFLIFCSMLCSLLKLKHSMLLSLIT